MAHSNVWSNTIPAGSAAANTIDSAIQQLRLDIQERMDEVVADWTADPVVPIVPTLATVRLSHTTTNAVATSTNVKAAWDTETFDTDAFHSTTVNNSRITIPADLAGYYLFGAFVFWSSDATGYRGVSLYKSGVAQPGGSYHEVTDVTVGINIVFPPIAAVATDYFELNLFQNSGSGLTITGDDAGDASSFWAVRIGI